MTPHCPAGTACADLLLKCAAYLCQCAWSQIYEFAQSPTDFVVTCIDTESEWFTRVGRTSDGEAGNVWIGPISRECFYAITPALPLVSGGDPVKLLTHATDQRVLALVFARGDECALYYVIPSFPRVLLH